MTRAAIYARFSSDLQRDTSIDDQVRNCERRAKQEGWTITQRYEDRAISGATDERGRPGYKQMLEDAEAKRFDVLLVDDLSRLSRDQLEAEKVRRNLVYWDVRLIGVNDGTDTDQEGHELVYGIKSVVNQDYLRRMAKQVHRGLTGQALKGNNCGGRAYGYRHVPIYHPTEKDLYGRPKQIGACREIDEAQAKWVRQIFTWYSEGYTPRWIAGELNRLGIPGPGAQYKRKRQSPRPGLWLKGVLQGPHRAHAGMLNNRLYVGQLVWNRREWKKNPKTGKARPKLRPESDWVITDVPHLRIIPQALWEKVQAQHLARSQEYVGANQAHCGRGPKYLLSGLLKCGTCGGNYVMASSYQYGCHSNVNGSTSACGNRLRVPKALVEEKILAGLKRDLFTPAWLDLFVKETTKLLAERNRQRRPDLDRTQRKLGEVEQVITNIMTAIKAGILTATTKVELEKAEAERARLQDAIKTTSAKADKVVTLLPRVAERYRAIIEDLARVTLPHVDAARQQIRDLVGEITLKPTAQGYLEAHLVGRFAGVAKLAVGLRLNNEVSPRAN